MEQVALVVDDDAAFLVVAAKVLAEMGLCTVLTAPDCGDAVREARARRPDAILVDVGLPDREGIDLARELLQLPWKPRVVLTSTDPDASLLVDGGRGSGAIPFVPKDELANGGLRALLIGD
jgi:CheY-like chemotaxis protein